MRGARKNNALGRNEDSKLALKGVSMTWIGVPKIVQAHAGQTGSRLHLPLAGEGIPRALQIVARLLRIIAGHHVGAKPFKPVQYCKGRGVNDDRLSAALAVRQEQTAALDINVLPSQVQDLGRLRSSEFQRDTPMRQQ